MIKRWFLYFVSFIFPWMILLSYDSVGAAIIAFAMQITFVAWPFATIWAIRVAKQKNQSKRKKRKSQSTAKKETSLT